MAVLALEPERETRAPMPAPELLAPEPAAPNEIGGADNPDGRAQDRRVELRFSAPPAP